MMIGLIWPMVYLFACVFDEVMKVRRQKEYGVINH
jgi:hypothetical protein